MFFSLPSPSPSKKCRGLQNINKFQKPRLVPWTLGPKSFIEGNLNGNSFSLIVVNLNQNIFLNLGVVCHVIQQ